MSTVVLGVSASIAAYKAVEVARLLLKAEVDVLPIMTRAAGHFIGAATLAGVCRRRVYSDMFEPSAAGELHVELAASADVVALVPATAELLAALAGGRADDLVRATALCARGPVVAAPAMHPSMWSHPATQRNIGTLERDGRVRLLGPVSGKVASGDTGMGRMLEPAAIAERLLELLGGARDLAGRHVVVTAGPTVEDLDPARFLSNRSSGRMGFAVAERAAARGARVTLVSGPASLPTPAGVERVDIRSAEQMREALRGALEQADALVMAAAVADYRPDKPRLDKLKRDADTLSLQLVKNPDLLAEIGQGRTGRGPYLVGFALETVAGDELHERARKKLERKGVDLIVANRAADAFERDDNLAMLVTADERVELPRLDKRVIADRILDRVRDATEPAETAAPAGESAR